MRIIRAAERFRTSQPGIESWHVFSAGPHYDPARLGVGALIGLDEHVLEPGARFETHAHRGVDIISWVVSGTLAHRDRTAGATAGATVGATAGSTAGEQLVRPGAALIQRTGAGIRHEEANASGHEPLRLVQATLLSASGEESAELAPLPLSIGDVTLDRRVTRPSWIYVLEGPWQGLEPGDFACVTEPPEGAGELLAWCVPSDS